MEDYLNNEVMEETTTPCEVEVVNETEASNNMPVYVPVQTDEPDSKGPNKALIALGVVGGLVAAKKVANKIRPKLEARKAKKAQEEEERILSVLKKTGLIVEPQKVEAAPAEAVEVKAEEVQAEKPDETKEDKTDKK